MGPVYRINNLLKILFPAYGVLTTLAGCSSEVRPEGPEQVETETIKVELNAENRDELMKENGWAYLARTRLKNEKLGPQLKDLNGGLSTPYKKREFLSDTAFFVVPVQPKLLENGPSPANPAPLAQTQPVASAPEAEIFLPAVDLSKAKNNTSGKNKISGKRPSAVSRRPPIVRPSSQNDPVNELDGILKSARGAQGK